MSRWLLLVLPTATVVVALLALAVPGRPLLVAVLAGLGGLLLAAALVAASERRLGQVADRLRQFADGATQTAVDPGGSRQWRRLVQALDAVSTTLRQGFADLADERARVERLLDNLPTAILVFTEEGLAYANPAARALFAIAREPEARQGRRQDADPAPEARQGRRQDADHEPEARQGLRQDADHEPEARQGLRQDPYRQAARTPLQVLAVEGLADAVVEARETGRTVEVEVKRADRDLAARASVTAAGEVALAVTDLTEARRVESIRRDFVTNASHELKTPVAGIQALAESLSLAVERDPARAKRMITRIHHEAARLGRMVRDLLDLARLEDLASEQGRRRVEVGALVRAQADRLDRLANEREVKVRCDIQDDAVVVAIPEDIRLIVANLLENAVRYNRPGGEVTVTVRPQRARVLVEVADTGIGISEADQDRVFERFYRVDKARSRAAGGTGLGLSLVRHATERHGGTVTVRSVLGEGSTFRVLLPVEGRTP